MPEGSSLSIYLLSAILLAPLVIISILARAHPNRTIAGVLYDAEHRGDAK